MRVTGPSPGTFGTSATSKSGSRQTDLLGLRSRNAGRAPGNCWGGDFSWGAGERRENIAVLERFVLEGTLRIIPFQPLGKEVFHYPNLALDTSRDWESTVCSQHELRFKVPFQEQEFRDSIVKSQRISCFPPLNHTRWDPRG